MPSNDAAFPQVDGAKSAVLLVVGPEDAISNEGGATAGGGGRGAPNVRTGFAIDLSNPTTSLPVTLARSGEIYALFYRCDLEAMGMAPGFVSTSSRTLVRTEHVLRGRLKGTSSTGSGVVDAGAIDTSFDGGALQWDVLADGVGMIARLAGFDPGSEEGSEASLEEARARVKDRWVFECAASLCDANESECDITFAVREDDHTLLLGGFEEGADGTVLRRARFGTSASDEAAESADAWPLCAGGEPKPTLDMGSGVKRRAAMRSGPSLYTIAQRYAEVFAFPDTSDDTTLPRTSSTTITSFVDGRDIELNDIPRWMTVMDDEAERDDLVAFLALTPHGEVVSLVDDASGRISVVDHGAFDPEPRFEELFTGMVLGNAWLPNRDAELGRSTPSFFSSYNELSDNVDGAVMDGAVVYAALDGEQTSLNQKGVRPRQTWSFNDARVLALARGVGDTIVVASSPNVASSPKAEEHLGGIHVLPYDSEALDDDRPLSPQTVYVRHRFNRPVVALVSVRSQVIAVAFEALDGEGVVDVWSCDLGPEAGARDLKPEDCTAILRDREISIAPGDEGDQKTAQTFADEVAVVTLPAGQALVLETCGLPGVGGSRSPE
ncbi:MAG: hypothetical protein IPK13_05965 [Deltaproteobacteria bacterium]|nr:hypothetical protein [Deltaproteobacteria bacterium]